ncbi:MAG TPA: hypothetical protein VKE74_28495 [Gemmataceae bacterium]|nr:hypothetical protein [Gemmataceae bacterium]
MTEPAKPPAPTQPPPTPTQTYHWADGLLFQTWLILFLGVICFALVNYLVSYIPK